MEENKKQVDENPKKKDIRFHVPDIFHTCNFNGCLEEFFACNSPENIILFFRAVSSPYLIGNLHNLYNLQREYSASIIENNHWRKAFNLGAWKLGLGSVVGWVFGFLVYNQTELFNFLEAPYILGAFGIFFQGIILSAFAVFIRLSDVKGEVDEDKKMAISIQENLNQKRADGEFPISLKPFINNKIISERIKLFNNVDKKIRAEQERKREEAKKK